MNKRIFYLFFVLLTFSFSAFAQEYLQTNYHFNLEKGLETRHIRSSFKDSRGFMWIATDVGAYRFDGFEFRPYKRSIKNNIPLSVERISEDEEGNLWFYHYNYHENLADFSILRNNKDTLIAIEDFFKNELPFPMSECFDNVSRTNNEKGIWIISRKSRDIYEYVGKQFKKIGTLPNYEGSAPIRHRQTFYLDKSSDGTNWLVYNGLLYRANAEQIYEKYDKLPLEFSNFRIDKKDRFWFTYLNEIYVKETKDTPISTPKFLESLDLKKVKEFKIESINDQFLVADCGRIDELLLIDHQSNKVLPIQISFDSSNSLITPRFIQLDQSNTVWVSTYEGIFQTTFQKNPFKNYLKGKSTRGIRRGNNGNLWVASYSGFFELDTNSGKEKEIDKTLKNGQGAYIDSQNNFWLGETSSTFLNISSVQPFEFKVHDLGLINGTVFNFYEHKKDSRLWAGTEAGLFVLNKEDNKFYVYDKLNEYEAINGLSIFDFEPIDESNFLIATSNGIFQLHLERGLIDHFHSSNNNFPYDFITFIHQDKHDNTFWVGTKMGGLIHWNFQDGKTERITTADGLSDNTIYTIYEDKLNKGYLWLPSNNGLMHFNKKTGEVTNYTAKDGIMHNEFNFYSNFEDEDGTLYFGGIQGVTSFHPEDFDVPESRPMLHITSIDFLEKKYNNEVTDFQSLNNGAFIILDSEKKAVKLSVAITDYKNPSAAKYFYKINDELSNNWFSMDGNSILINGLSAGNHTVYLKAKNEKGIWAQNKIEISIKMLAPFYLRWWFLTLMALVLFGLVKLFIKGRTFKLEKDKENLELEVARRTQEIEEDRLIIEKQAKELQQLDEIKSRFFANVTHELRTPLTLIIGPLQQLLKSDKIKTEKVRKTLESIATNGTQLKQLVEEILDLNRLDAQKIVLNNEPTHLREVIEKWVNIFSPEAENRNIQFKLKVETESDLYLNLDVQKLERIVVNLLANAFKYSEGEDTIFLRVTEDAQHIKIEIEDTGLGIHEADLPHIFHRFYQTKQAQRNLMGGLGIGLALSKELAELMKGRITVKSKEGVGSSFIFVFPKEKVEGIIPPTISQDRFPISKEAEQIVKIGERNHRNILIVEDNLQMQKFVCELLEPFADIQLANNGKVALKLLERKDANVDLIVSDVMMPEMDGFTFLKLLKQKKKWQLTPIVFLTARADILDKIKGFTIGVDDYMVKPFDPDELIARVNNLFDKLESRSEIETIDTDSKIELSTEPIVNKKDFKLLNEFEKTESADFIWLKEIEQIAINNIDQSNFNVIQFAFKVHLGERQLGRKLKKLTGMTPGNYLKEVRLQKARHLLENKVFSTVSEVAFTIGFTTPEYFSKVYKKRFGKLPTEYVRNVRKK